MTTAGKPAPGSKTLVYALGFHNVESLTWDRTKHLYAIDAGTRTADNLDVVTAGGNYGWPLVGTPKAPAGVHQPIQTWPLDQSGCSGVATIDNALATACPTGKRLWLAQLTAKANVFGAPAAVFTDSFGRLRAVAAAPDGSLWVSTSNTDGHGTPKPNDDEILRIVLANEGAGVT
jgi:glucose/arabinose dehydrogenase